MRAAQHVATPLNGNKTICFQTRCSSEWGRRFAQNSAAFEQRGIGRRGMRGAVANECSQLIRHDKTAALNTCYFVVLGS